MRSYVLLLALVAAPRLGGAQPASTELAVRRLDSLWTSAYVQHDTAQTVAVMAPEIVITSSTGARKDRSAELADVRAVPGLTVHSFVSTDVQVRTRSTVAIVTGVIEWDMTWQGARSKNRRRYTATYAPGGPLGWQMIALHIGPA